MINTESNCNFYVQVTNYGLFYLRFTLYYCIGKDRFISKTDPFPIGGYRRIYYPVNAECLKVNIETSIYIEKWVKIFEENFPGRSNLCFLAYGLTFAPFVEKVCSEKKDFSYTIPLISKLAYDKTYCNTSCNNSQSFCDNIECSYLENICNPIEVPPIPCNIKKQCCNCSKSSCNIPIDFDESEYTIDIASIKEDCPYPSEFLQEYFHAFNNTSKTSYPCSNFQPNTLDTHTFKPSNFDSCLCSQKCIPCVDNFLAQPYPPSIPLTSQYSLAQDNLVESGYGSSNINYSLENSSPSSCCLCINDSINDNINSSYAPQSCYPFMNNLNQQTCLYYRSFTNLHS